MEIEEIILNPLYFLVSRLSKPQVHIHSAIDKGDVIEVKYWLFKPEKNRGNTKSYLVDETTRKKLKLARHKEFLIMRKKDKVFPAAGTLVFEKPDKSIGPGSVATLKLGFLKEKNIAIK